MSATSGAANFKRDNISQSVDLIREHGKWVEPEHQKLVST